MHIAIIGAGIAGLSCADALIAGGHQVVLFDKSRGTGGRMSSRRVLTTIGPASFDHGAQYFTVRDPAFMAQVAGWAARGLAAPWPVAGEDAWVGVPTMNAPVRAMADRHHIVFGQHVQGLIHDDHGWWIRLEDSRPGPFDAVIVAVPAEQAAALLGLHDIAMASHAMMARSQPCWTAMIAFEDRLRLSNDHFRDRGIIAWAARNSAKPGRLGPECWVVQASGPWSAAHIEDHASDVAQHLAEALLSLTSADIPVIVSQSAHRWRFAMNRGCDLGALWNGTLGLGACGDWLMGPRVELAWLSGRTLAAQVSGQTIGKLA